ncbi:nuclear transport factor 2 family protein [Cupriavidus pampae]|uniref:Nuclear transport factor 2 family protein n=1 Tax=Cupriavidus pampae TaxID=659251 RepID=A0ABM8WW13_9BURK|nr:nuclear transport factor 2 family protein [Cupriavidus pampae]CAG9171711.1 hypothetical protein LMG32289_02462 [Cupriavidus pampae]
MADERTEIDAACRDVLDRFMDALNAHDADAMDACMHFPHVRFAGGNIKVYEAAGSNPMDLFQKLRDEDDWRYSTWRERELVQFNGNKAHVALSYTRFRGNGSVIGIYESLYVLTRIDGRWGIQIRSSFGP